MDNSTSEQPVALISVYHKKGIIEFRELNEF